MSDSLPSPPPKLAKQCWDEHRDQTLILKDSSAAWDKAVALAYRAGWKERDANSEAELQKARDEEMEACEALILKMRPHGGRAWTLEQAAVNDALTAVVTELRATRRPSLKQRIAVAIEDGDERTALRLLDEALPE